MNQRIAKTITELETFMAPRDDALSLPRAAAEFVHTLVLATGARSALEIGTSFGYSGIWIASALASHGGSLKSIDHDPAKSNAAREWIDKAGLSSHVELLVGEAADVLSRLKGPFDFVLVDADKENCIRYVEGLTKYLSAGAIILTDNISTHAEELRDFLHWIRHHDDFCSVGIPIGNGMELSVRYPERAAESQQ